MNIHRLTSMVRDALEDVELATQYNDEHNDHVDSCLVDDDLWRAGNYLAHALDLLSEQMED